MKQIISAFFFCMLIANSYSRAEQQECDLEVKPTKEAFKSFSEASVACSDNIINRFIEQASNEGYVSSSCHYTCGTSALAIVSFAIINTRIDVYCTEKNKTDLERNLERCQKMNECIANSTNPDSDYIKNVKSKYEYLCSREQQQ